MKEFQWSRGINDIESKAATVVASVVNEFQSDRIRETKRRNGTIFGAPFAVDLLVDTFTSCPK